MASHRLHNPTPARRDGFTLVELLVVILILIALISITGVAVSRAFQQGKRAATSSLMRGISIAIEQFEADFDYLPPLLHEDPSAGASDDRLAVTTSLDDAGVKLGRQRFYSVLTLPIYLVGVGPLSGVDSDDPARHDGVEGPGFHDPGPDRSWGGARDRDTQRPIRTGRVYGPYMDTASGSGQFFARVDEDAPFSLRDGFVSEDAGLPSETTDALFKEEFEGFFVFLDAWGKPIRYYRNWPTRDRDNPDEFALDRVPVELLDPDVLENWSAGQPLSTRFDRDLLGAGYALLSAGSDEIFADADPQLPSGSEENLGFVTEEIASDFSNQDRFQALSGEEFDFLFETIRDNVRVLP